MGRGISRPVTEGAFEPHDHYADGAWYDAEYVHIRGDVPHYARVAAETAGPILELACGTGRLTFPMLEAGDAVVGIDAAPGMIARADERRAALAAEDRARVRFQVADLRTLDLGERFSGVVLAFNSLMHMTTDEDLTAAFETVRRHLDPGGLFHFDLHTPLPELLYRDPNGRYDPQEMIDPATGDRYVVTESNDYDPRTQINRLFFHYQKVHRDGRPAEVRERRAELALRVIFPRELDRWLSSSGFEIAGEWDDFERRQPFSGRGGRRIVAARVRKRSC